MSDFEQDYQEKLHKGVAESIIKSIGSQIINQNDLSFAIAAALDKQYFQRGYGQLGREKRGQSRLIFPHAV